jgi:hypothetical protein
LLSSPSTGSGQNSWNRMFGGENRNLNRLSALAVWLNVLLGVFSCVQNPCYTLGTTLGTRDRVISLSGPCSRGAYNLVGSWAAVAHACNPSYSGSREQPLFKASLGK